MSPTTVLIVDDDHYAREALGALVSRDARTRVWGSVATLAAASELLEEERLGTDRPDVILLDVRLAEGERAGIDAIGWLRLAAPVARILVTSVSSDDDTVLAAIRAGADGYVWKNETTEGIATAIERVAQGRFVLSRSIADRLIGKNAELAAYTAEALPDRPEFRELTEAVRKTLYLFCVVGLSAREIADELQISVNTVHARIKAAYATLGATSRSEAFRMLVDATAGTNGSTS